MKVLKFGGTSVGSPERMKAVSKLLIEGSLHEHDTVIVNYVNDRFIVKKKI